MGVRVLMSMLCIPCVAGMRLGQPTPIPRAASYTHAVLAAAQPASPMEPAKGRLLVASRTLLDPNFTGTVVLLLSADAHGTLGIVINRPTQVKLATVLPDLKELRGRKDRVFLGGPIGTNALLLLIRGRRQPAKSEKIVEEVYATGSRAALRDALGRKEKTGHRLRAFAGYAGWAPGQLEREIARGDWLVGSADGTTIFDLAPSDMWPKLIERFSGAWAKAFFKGGDPGDPRSGVRGRGPLTPEPPLPPAALTTRDPTASSATCRC